MPALAAIILAAGASTRMGRPKQLLMHQGQTFLRRTIAVAEDAGCSPIIVVLGSSADQLQNECVGTAARIVLNADWQRGMGTSIRTGMHTLKQDSPDADRVVLLLCDQPRITSDTIRRLDQARRESGKAVSVAAFDDTIGPPVIVMNSLFAALMNLPDDRGAKEIWTSHPELVLKVECPEARFDIDTPANYAALQVL